VAVSEPGPDLLVLDTYDRAAWQRVAALPHRLLAAFEDALPQPGAAGVVIGPRYGAGPDAPSLELACLRRPFWGVGARVIRDQPQRVLVTTGGSDLGGLAARIATRLGEQTPQVQVELVWGPGFAGEPPQGVAVLDRPESLLGPLLRADAVVCTGGQTMLEAAATGTPALVLEGAPNQRPQIAGLAARGAVLPVGEEEVPEALERLLGSAEQRRELSSRAQEAVDGRGALRIAEELAALTQR
jgi:spore coat polysaccharide biosynthesis predicted glycosyltransferase SpsG